MLENSKRLLASKSDRSDPLGLLVEVLEASIELVALDDNDFAWSSWQDRDAAVTELRCLLAFARQGGVPSRLSISNLFAPTGPMQELSMSSGWAKQFLRVAERFDSVEAALWPPRT